jgi:hypothetical protein
MVASAVQMAVNGGSGLLIFVRHIQGRCCNAIGRGAEKRSCADDDL